jgi:hypothetical protein
MAGATTSRALWLTFPPCSHALLPEELTASHAVHSIAQLCCVTQYNFVFAFCSSTVAHSFHRRRVLVSSPPSSTYSWRPPVPPMGQKFNERWLGCVPPSLPWHKNTR